MEKTGRKTPCKCVIGNELDQEKENTEKGWVCPQCLSRNSDYLNFCIICAGFNPIKKLKKPYYIFKNWISHVL